ncbi:MAG TPA: hypothetical protein VN597_20050, partial [Streptosporangiaceae bacterium]|nr:hypothetical protein [Streptosporangiaceae bacterium]
AGLLAGGAGGAVRNTGAGRSPRLRAAAGHRTDGWIGGSRDQPGQRTGPWVDRPRPLRLRLRGGTAGSAVAGQPANGKPARPLATVNLRLGTPRRRDGAVVARRYLAGAAPGAAFENGSRNWSSRSTRLRGSALTGGPSALGQAPGRKQRQPRLKLGSKRRRDGVAGGSRFGIAIWPGGRSRRRRMGRGSFASGSLARNGGATARAAAAPKFRARSRKPAAAPHTAAPRFRRPARWKRAGRALGSRGAGAKLRAPRWRRRFSRLGKGGWR